MPRVPSPTPPWPSTRHCSITLRARQKIERPRQSTRTRCTFATTRPRNTHVPRKRAPLRSLSVVPRRWRVVRDVAVPRVFLVRATAPAPAPAAVVVVAVARPVALAVAVAIRVPASPSCCRTLRISSRTRNRATRIHRNRDPYARPLIARASRTRRHRRLSTKFIGRCRIDKFSTRTRARAASRHSTTNVACVSNSRCAACRTSLIPSLSR